MLTAVMDNKKEFYMKKRVIGLCCVLGVFLIVILVMALMQNKEAKFNPAEDITMEIVEGTLTNTSATIVITDLSGEDNIYDEAYRIDKLEDEKWYTLDDIIEGNVLIAGTGLGLDENNQLKQEINWEKYYGPLEKGKYRIVKNASNRQVATEFTIE